MAHSPTSTRWKVRKVPARDNLGAIDLGSPYASALIGGFEQGAGLPIGLELTTARKIPAIEFRVRALASTRLYQRFEAGALAPLRRGPAWGQLGGSGPLAPNQAQSAANTRVLRGHQPPPPSS